MENMLIAWSNKKSINSISQEYNIQNSQIKKIYDSLNNIFPELLVDIRNNVDINSNIWNGKTVGPTYF